MPFLGQLPVHKILTYGSLCLIGLYLLLALPPSAPDVPEQGPSLHARPFLWNQDARWDSLEEMYVKARRAGCDTMRLKFDASMRGLQDIILHIETHTESATSPAFSHLEERIFQTATLLGACPRGVPDFLALVSRLRSALKRQSERWDMTDRQTREILYRLLYGTRSAAEEVILQTPREQRPSPLLEGTQEPSATPAAVILDVTVHSGDILVSRGGAPTSALIARGNDFPGNFSHAALVYVDSATGRLSIIESHIEYGVTVSTREEYLRDTKLRILVLRLRADLPILVHDPLLPHRAASMMLRRARAGHIPYDFAMAHDDSTELFCSEVVSSAYGMFGVHLWIGKSYISSPGLRGWLGDFGVRHFATEEPSDLEYDPQVRVVAEWRDPETLRKDHLDNAVTEAMLEGAERGDRLRYDWYLLPIARVVKAYSVVLNLFGFAGPIPEGMSAAAGLKHEDYVTRHEAAVAAVRESADRFRHDRGFEPPYWRLLQMARTSLQRED